MEDLTAIKRMPINKEAAPGISQVRGDNVRLVGGSQSSSPALKENLVLDPAGSKKSEK